MTVKASQHLRLLLAVWVVCIGSGIDVRAFSFRVTGAYRSSLPEPNGTWKLMQEKRFEVSVRDWQWLIKIDASQQAVFYYGSNGTNTFSVLYDSKGPTNALPGSIQEDQYPVNGAPDVTVLWFAFCSADSIDRGLPLPAPWADARTTPLAYIYEMHVQRFHAPPALPSHIEFVTSVDREKSAAQGRYLFREKLDEQAKHLRSFNYQTLAGDGRLGGEYKVLVETNYNGLLLPIHCEVLFYDHLKPSFKANSTAVPRIRYECVVDSVGDDVPPGKLLPPIDRRIDIVDYRLKDSKPIDFILYTITNRAWPETITSEMQANLDRRKAFDLLSTLDRAASVRTLFTILLVLALILPLAIKVAIQRRKKTQHKSQ